MLSLAAAPLSFSPAAALAPTVQPRASLKMESAAELKDLAIKLNPTLGYWDPMNLAEYDQFSVGQDASIGFLRHAEIKHGRVAMAAFVGYCIQSNGIYFPWKLTGDVTHASISAAGSPPDQWDALPSASKVQILLFVGFLEICGESTYILEQSGMKHYMKGGKAGCYPSISKVMPHPVPLDLFDPFGLQSKMAPQQKEKSLLAEINNGRLAMLGIMAFLAEGKVPGSVPALAGKIPAYAGEVMAPFSSTDAGMPFVSDMLKVSIF